VEKVFVFSDFQHIAGAKVILRLILDSRVVSGKDLEALSPEQDGRSRNIALRFSLISSQFHGFTGVGWRRLNAAGNETAAKEDCREFSWIDSA
jgi:hypothetical protein